MNGHADDAERRLEDVMTKVAEMHDQCAEIPSIKHLLERMITSTDQMAESAKSIAKSVDRSETRQEKLESLVSGKGQIPIESHNRIVRNQALWSNVPTAVLAIVLAGGAIWYYNFNIDASLTSLKVGQGQVKEEVQKAKHELQEKVSEVAVDVGETAKQAAAELVRTQKPR